ncbi:hypothetical protein UlMin_039998 [Ulmus minor]
MNNVSASNAAVASSSSSATVVPAISNQGNGEEKEENGSEQSDSGFIFMCNGRTKPECYRYRVFGLPLGKFEVVQGIKPGTKLFLFDFDVKLLYGIYEATSNGQLHLEPAAFNGNFPAQVKFKIFKECLPLPQSAFKVAIKDNYQGSKFRQELSSQQVNGLISLFRPLTLTALASSGPPLSQLARPYSIPATIEEERFRPPPRLPQFHCRPVGKLNDNHPKHIVAHSLYDQYGIKTRAACVQPPIKHQHIAFQQAADSYCIPDAHNPYLPENSSSSRQDPRVQPAVEHQLFVQQVAYPHNAESYSIPEAHHPYLHENPSNSQQDPYRRHGASLEIVRDLVNQYGIDYTMSQLPRERGREMVRDLVYKYGTDYTMSQLPRERGSEMVRDLVYQYGTDYNISQLPRERGSEMVPGSEYLSQYYNQQLPTAISHVSSRSQTLPPSFTLPSHQQGELPHVSSQLQTLSPSYALPGHQQTELPHVSSQSQTLSPSYRLHAHQQVELPHVLAESQTLPPSYRFPAHQQMELTYVSSQSQTLPLSYTLPAHQQAELPAAAHEPYYPLPTSGNLSQAYAVPDPLQMPLPGSSEANVTISSQSHIP